MPFSYINVHSSGKNIECPALQRHYFSIDRDVHGCAYFEFDAAYRSARSKWMLDVRPVVESRKIAQQAEAADRAPSHKFNEPIGGIGIRRDEHRAARVLAVVERQEKRPSLVPFLIVIA